MLLRYFRAPELAVWSLVVIGLGVLTYFSFTIGGGETETVPTVNGSGVAVKSATVSDAGGYVRDLQTLMPHGVASGTDVQALATWGQLVQQYADAGVEARQDEGAGVGDGLFDLLTVISNYGGQLQNVGDDFVTAGSLRTQIGLAVDQAVALISGLPVPGMSDSFSRDPVGVMGGEPQEPVADVPTSPSAPTVPGTGRAPQREPAETFPSPPDLSTIFKE